MILYVGIVDANVLKARQEQSNFYRWIEAYRTHSHRIAATNPIPLTKLADERYSFGIILFSFSITKCLMH